MNAELGEKVVLREGERHIARCAKGFLLDWDGCCAVENKMLPGAVVFLSRHAERSVIVSNNSTNTEGDFAPIMSRYRSRFAPVAAMPP